MVESRMRARHVRGPIELRDRLFDIAVLRAHLHLFEHAGRGPDVPAGVHSRRVQPSLQAEPCLNLAKVKVAVEVARRGLGQVVDTVSLAFLRPRDLDLPVRLRCTH